MHKTHFVRNESEADFASIHHLIKLAFKDHPYSNHKEQLLVRELRQQEPFKPEFSLVSCLTKNPSTLSGFILLTEVNLQNESTPLPQKALALAPLVVDPNYQASGIGTMLIKTAHELAKKNGYEVMLLVGDPLYYTRFGYEEALLYKVKLPYELPSKYCMIHFLNERIAFNEMVQVVYPEIFNTYHLLDE